MYLPQMLIQMILRNEAPLPNPLTETPRTRPVWAVKLTRGVREVDFHVVVEVVDAGESSRAAGIYAVKW